MAKQASEKIEAVKAPLVKTALVKRLDEIAERFGDKRKDGKVASDRTQEATRQVLGTAFNVLLEKGFRLHEPANLGDKHMKVLVKTWYEESGLVPKTIKNYLSCMNRVYTRMGKRGLIKNIEYYLPHVDPALLKLKANAEKSKSWTEAGIDVLAKIAEADELDDRFGLMLRAMLSFGLRRKEVLKCKPWKAAEDNDKVWRIYPTEAKNGRPRIIMIETEAQVVVLNCLRARLKKGERICWSLTPRGKRATDKWAVQRYNELMRRIGITMDENGATGHGLRSQYAENAALIAGIIPPTLSGDGREMNKEDLDRTRAMISENLGHSRIAVTGAYYGSFSKLPRINKEKVKQAIENCISAIRGSGKSQPLLEDLRADCKSIMAVLSDYDVPVSLSEVQAVWRRYSERHGVEWLSPKDPGEIERGLYVVATMPWRKGDDEGTGPKGRK